MGSQNSKNVTVKKNNPYVELHKNIYEKYSGEEGVKVRKIVVTLSIVQC